MFDMLSMMGKLKDFQAKMKAAQEQLVHLKTTAEAGGGMVKVTVNGQKQIISIEVDPTMTKPEDQPMVNALIMSAANKALADIDEEVRAYMTKQTEGILPAIPGLDLSKLTGG
jgi:DNA-binding YbaB/EbfC family protein